MTQLRLISELASSSMRPQVGELLWLPGTMAARAKVAPVRRQPSPGKSALEHRDAVAPILMVAAGGIADGRGLAAALMLGAHGVLIGTRFYASTEALGPDGAKQRIVAAHGSKTARTCVFDIVRGYAWPPGYPGRALRNRCMERWHGRESDLAAALETERTAYQVAARDGGYDTAVVWAGEGVDLIKSVEGAAALVARISAEAEAQLRIGAKLAH